MAQISTYFSNKIKKGKTCYSETTETASSASFLDLYLEFDDSGQLNTKIYDKLHTSILKS
jgi:hypothetical protein